MKWSQVARHILTNSLHRPFHSLRNVIPTVSTMCWISTEGWLKVWRKDEDAPMFIHSAPFARPVKQKRRRKMRVLKVPVPYDRYVFLKSPPNAHQDGHADDSGHKGGSNAENDSHLFGTPIKIDKAKAAVPLKSALKKPKVSSLLPYLHSRRGGETSTSPHLMTPHTHVTYTCIFHSKLLLHPSTPFHLITLHMTTPSTSSNLTNHGGRQWLRI
jgi:hypothetical protein